ncbi:GAF domain-containing protein, partial [bacterium]|nr:GAF domain-containing protein [bacterium]
EVIHKKTNGNPLFVKELLKSAYEENKLTFVPGLGWKWNFQQINDMRFSESMAALMAERIAGYDRNIQTIIKTSACLGSSFDLTILSDIIEKPVEQMVSGFKKLVEDGYFYQTENKYKFRHNRIKEVAYSLLSDVEKSETHYRIAKTWIKHSTEETIHQKIFKIVNHYNAGSAVVKSKAEKRYLASLNLRAGEQSKASSAFSSARIYLEKGLTFLSDESWNEDYELTLLLYQNAAEIALFTANHENLEKLGQEVLDHAKNMLDKTKIYTFRIRSLMERFRHPEALSMGIMVLKQMGIEINENIEKEYIKSEYIKTKNALLDNLDKLDKLPEIEDPKMLVAIRIMAHLIIGTYFIPGGGRLRLLLSFKPTQLALEHGRSPMALSAISVMGTIMCAEGDIDEGCEIGRIALEQADYFKYKAVIPRLQYLFATHIIYHKRSLKDIAEDYLDIYQKALEVGDLEIASMAVFQHVNHLMYKNYSSSQILAEVNTYRPHLKQMGAEFWFQNVTILGQYHSNLNGEAIDPTVLNGKYFNKEIMLPILWQNNFLSTVLMVYFQECLLLLSFEKYVEAFTLMEKAVPYLRTVRSTISEMNANFYFSIIRLAAYPQMTPPVQKKILEQVEEDQKQLKAWADKASTNHLHRYFLVEAEKARVQKTDSSKTMDLYQKALVSAEKANLDLEIIYDRTAGFWFEKGMTDIAELYFIKAHRVAPPAKKDFYSLKYPHFFCKDDIFSISNTTSSTITKKQSDSTIDSESSQSTTSTEILDMNTVVRASQAISGEIILDKLLFKMTKIAMENAGAQKGFLIRKSLDNVYIEAAADNNKESSVDVKAIPLDESKELCQAIVNYVIRTGEDIVLHNALAKGDFAQDPYIKQNEIKSVLCTPFRYKEEIYGAFYLENNLVSFAFTKDRIKLLQVLLSQAAISMENAELFEKHIQDQKELTNHRDHLEKLVKERTLELEKVHRDLVEKAHQAGMAEIAINTLHNIGNILNSVKTSSQITLGVLRQSEFSSFKKANNLLKEHMDHIEDFIANDPKGKKLLDYYIKMEEVLEKEQNLIDDNVARIVDKVGDIEEVISAQRKYTEVGSVLITYSLPTIVEDVLTMQSKLFEGPPIKIVKNFKKVPDILTQKSKLMNILTNLIMNAKDAMDGNVDNRVLTITIENDEKWLYLKIQDTGKGIPHENLKKIFAFGFTTTIGNLGFGLHFSANSMKEMGGDMWAESDGEKKGAAFILKFPLSQSTSSKK